MKRRLLLVVLMAFLISSPFGSRDAHADDLSANTTKMQATINAQAAEIVQLRKERDRLKANVDQGWAIVQQKDKEGAELKKMVANLEKELRICRGTSR